MDQHGKELVGQRRISQIDRKDQLYTEPMNGPRQRSTYGFVVNHSHRKTEAKTSQSKIATQFAWLTLAGVDRVSEGLETGLDYRFLAQASHTASLHTLKTSLLLLRPASFIDNTDAITCDPLPRREMPNVVPLRSDTLLNLDSLPAMIALL